MLSLTQYIKEGRKISKDYFGTEKFTFPKLTIPKELVNPYPESLGQRKLWGLIGTFTDYMIRKMFRDCLVSKKSRIVKERELIAEIVPKHLPDLVLALKSINMEMLAEIDWYGNDWIKTYLEKPLDECIEDAFQMSQLDSVYRGLRVGKRQYLNRSEMDGIEDYLAKILEWLQIEFKDSETVILNPVLGHPDVCKADADIIIDDTLFEIKTVKRPHAEVEKSKHQLLGYLSLAHHHQSNPVDESPVIPHIKEIGYLFPQSLSTHSTTIENFTEEDQEQFCRRILSLRSDEQSPKSPKEIDPRSTRAAYRKMLLHNRAARFIEKNMLDDAEVVYRSILAEDPLARMTFHALARLLVKKGDLDDAERAIKQANEISSGWPKQWHLLVTIYKQQGREKEMLSAAKSWVKHCPNYALGWFVLGVIYHNKGKLKHAEEAYRIVIEIEPSHLNAVLNLGILLVNTKRKNQAIVLLEEGLRHAQEEESEVRSEVVSLLDRIRSW